MVHRRQAWQEQFGEVLDEDIGTRSGLLEKEPYNGTADDSG